MRISIIVIILITVLTGCNNNENSEVSNINSGIIIGGLDKDLGLVYRSNDTIIYHSNGGDEKKTFLIPNGVDEIYGWESNLLLRSGTTLKVY